MTKNAKRTKIKYEYFLIIIILLGAFLRLYNLSWDTFIFDEVPTIKSSEQYLNGNFMNFFGLDVPPLLKYTSAATMAIFGLSETALRTQSALFGIATIALTYFFVVKFYKDKRMALLAASLTSFSILHLTFSRYLELLVPVGFFYLLSMYFLLDFVQNKNKRSAYYFGIALALGLLTKNMMLYAILSSLIYLVIKRHIFAGVKPWFHVRMDNSILKGLLAGLVVFLVLWPFFLYPVKVDMSASINGGHERNITLSVPFGALSYGDVGSSYAANRQDYGVRSVPFIGYLLLFCTKESLVIVLLAAAGLYSAAKTRNDNDKFILFILFMFFLLLSVQNWGYTFRYIAVVMPFIAILASRWIIGCRKTLSLVIIAAATALLLLNAALVQPNYVLFYNPINEAVQFSNLESHFSEGMGESLDFIRDNCTSVLSDTGSNYMIYVYNETLSDFTPHGQDCVLIAVQNVPEAQTLYDYVSGHKCNLARTVFVRGIERYEIFKC